MGIELGGLEGKVAVVTGASRMRGIGHSIAVELARGGCDVVVTGSGRSPDRYPDDEKAAGWRDIESVADRVEALGRKALAMAVDVSDPAAVDRLTANILAQFGRIDFLVNNAAASRGGDRVEVSEMPVEEWDKVFAVNVRGTFLMSRAVARELKRQGFGGAIVNISSVAGLRPGPSSSAYSASKAAVQALGVSLALELAPHNIRVNSICPGTVQTSRLPQGQLDDRIKRGIPLGRASDGSEIAAMVTFLCSDQGSWITGDVIPVDGGTSVLRRK